MKSARYSGSQCTVKLHCCLPKEATTPKTALTFVGVSRSIYLFILHMYLYVDLDRFKVTVISSVYTYISVHVFVFAFKSVL